MHFPTHLCNVDNIIQAEGYKQPILTGQFGFIFVPQEFKDLRSICLPTLYLWRPPGTPQNHWWSPDPIIYAKDSLSAQSAVALSGRILWFKPGGCNHEGSRSASRLVICKNIHENTCHENYEYLEESLCAGHTKLSHTVMRGYARLITSCTHITHNDNNMSYKLRLW